MRPSHRKKTPCLGAGPGPAYRKKKRARGGSGRAWIIKPAKRSSGLARRTPGRSRRLTFPCQSTHPGRSSPPSICVPRSIRDSKAAEEKGGKAKIKSRAGGRRRGFVQGGRRWGPPVGTGRVRIGTGPRGPTKNTRLGPDVEHTCRGRTTQFDHRTRPRRGAPRDAGPSRNRPRTGLPPVGAGQGAAGGRRRHGAIPPGRKGRRAGPRRRMTPPLTPSSNPSRCMLYQNPLPMSC